MAETFSRVLANNGLGVKIAATASPGTLIFTAVAGTTNIDEIHLGLVNTSSSDITVYIQFGGTNSPDNLIPVRLPGSYEGLFVVSQGELQLQNGAEIRAYANTANVIVAYCYANRITVS